MSRSKRILRWLLMWVGLGLVLAGCITLPGCPVVPGARFDPARGPVTMPTEPTATPLPEPSRESARPLPPPPTRVPPNQAFASGVEVRLFAGTGARGGLDGPAREANFDGPFDLALDVAGHLYVTELGSGRIRVIDPQGFVWTWVGKGGQSVALGSSSHSPFLNPQGIVVASQGRVYVADERQHLTMIQDGRLVPLSGPMAGFRDGPIEEAAFRSIGDIALGPGGVLCLSDTQNNRIRMLTPEGTVGTLAGSGDYGHTDGPAIEATFGHPNGLALDSRGWLYVADGGPMESQGQGASAYIRVLSPSGEVSTAVGGTEQGYVDGPALQARFRSPVLGLTFDQRDNLYIADTNNHAIRLLRRDGQVLTLAGTGEYGRLEGPGNRAMLGLPAGVLWDGKESLYVADYGQNVIWKIVLR